MKSSLLVSPLLVAPLVGALLVTACTASEVSRGESGTADVRDSAGVRIVVSVRPAAVDTIAAAPMWELQSTAESESEPLFDVGDMVATAKGGVVVANNGNASVVAFGADGAEQWRFGRRGAGPGEFQGEISLAAIGDTVFAYDFNTRRLTRIAPDGTLSGLLQIALPNPNLILLGGRAGGDLVFTSRHLLGPVVGINRDSVVYLAVRTDGRLVGEVGWGRHRNVDFVMGEYGPNIHDEALGPSGSVAVLGDGVAAADGRTAEVSRRDATGVITHLLRWNEMPSPVTEADRRSFASSQRIGTPEGRRLKQLEEWLAKATWPETKPLTDLVVARPDGRVLVASFCPYESTRCPWREFDAEGVWQRTISLPVRALTAVMAGDLLVTLAVDDVGFERLQAWQVR